MKVVFSTGMVGYPESLTDASYQGQVRNNGFDSSKLCNCSKLKSPFLHTRSFH